MEALHEEVASSSRQSRSSSSKMSSKQDKKKHNLKVKKSEKMSRSAKLRKRRRKKHNKDSVSPVRVTPPEMVRSPSPPPTAKKSRVSANMNDTSLFAKLVKANHPDKKKEVDEEINESTKVDKTDKSEEKCISNQDADLSKCYLFEV